MAKYAEYYLVVDSDGKWRGVCSSFPPKELDEKTDISLSPQEYYFIKGIKSLAEGYEHLDSVKDKIKEVLERNTYKDIK